MIEENVKNLLENFPEYNRFGEKVILVAAVKTQTVDAINCAISAGVSVIGDNHAQEFRDKYDKISGNPERHFIGHLQTNKLKYLIGKVDLFHSVDRVDIAKEISKRSQKADVTSNILLQINIGNEETKSGFDINEITDAHSEIVKLPNVKVLGLMAMLPESDDENLLRELAAKMRQKYDYLRAFNPDMKYLSMGMSGDWQLCVDCGSNMVRLGTAIFGKRNYN